MIAERVRSIPPSATLRVSALARKLRQSGVDVLDFSVGEPDFPTPGPAKTAAKDAIDADFTRYTDNAGMLDLRRAIADKLLRDNGVSYAAEEILVSPGAKASLYFAAVALLDPGDEVVVPSPYWVSYPEQVRLAGATPVFVETREEDGFLLRPEILDAAIGPRTRAVILNYPSNPTGACYERGDLAALAEVCVRRSILVISDEIYEKLLYDGRTFTSFASLGDAVRARTVLVNGMSKAFAMTGWRVGYAAAPKGLVDAMAAVQGHATSHPASMAQAASLEALRSCAPDVARMAREFAKRRDAMVSGLRSIPGLRCTEPAGAFYVFPNVSGLFGRELGGKRLRSGSDVVEMLLERARVAAVPGEAFGSERHIRLSYACSMDQIREGLARISQALA